jgi:Family of unknown function (DUF6481)
VISIDPSNRRRARPVAESKRKYEMKRNQTPDLWQRQNDSAQAKKGMLEKFRAKPGPDDPAVAARRAARETMHAERAVRAVKREATKQAREADLAEQAVRAAELAAQAEREAAEETARAAAEQAKRETAILAEQKAARDQRYAARKAAKKQRRKG